MRRIAKRRKECNHVWGKDDFCIKCKEYKVVKSYNMEELIRLKEEVAMTHKGLKNLYDQVVSGVFEWNRWGLLSALSDYVLFYTPGDILEIGCGESSIHFSKLAEKYNRVCYHVEISKSGVENMRNTEGYFGNNSVVYNVSSDNFFEMERPTPLALAFIDGDHNYEQVKKDFYNTWKYMINGGYVFLHDTVPPDESWTVPHKCGTVYKLREEIEHSLDSFTFKRSAFDVGLTMVRHG